MAQVVCMMNKTTTTEHMEKNNMTAVEWLVNQILLKHTEIVQFLPNWSFDKSIIEQAKQMEKEQIINAYRTGWINYLPDKDSEQYYNETYGKQ